MHPLLLNLASAAPHTIPVSTDPDTLQLIIGAILFLGTYACIAFEKKIGINKTVASLVGAKGMLLLILRAKHLEGTEYGAYQLYIKFDVIFLLMGMMIVVHLLSETGLFQYVAIRCAKIGRGEPLRVLVLLVIVTATLSAVLDNVTTVLLISPMTLLLAQQLQLNPLTFLIPQALASNIGGTATMIGDPPNILVGTYAKYAGINFASFLTVLAPFVALVMAIFVGVICLRLSGKWKVNAEQRARIMDMEENRAIRDPALLRKGLVAMGLTLVGFLLHGVLHIEPGVVAMSGAAFLLLFTKRDVEEALEGVEWSTLLFFMGLFIVVSGAMEVGLFALVAQKIFALTGDNPYVAVVLVLWVSGICAGGINAFSFTAAALPVVKSLAGDLGLEGAASQPLWWALALGACLGGNLTPIGTAANLVVMDISEKSGHPISFGEFMKWGVPTALCSLVLSTGYVLMLMYWTLQVT